MCGICGIFNIDRTEVSSSVLSMMNNTMKMRGPDNSGQLIDGNFGMAMRRLSIIDLDSGKQPISNEDGTIHIVLNGELYNYIELRSELQQKGHIFKTRSDVEVLLHLYEDHGLEAVHYLNGMFAFCVWDKSKKMVWIGRDRLGIKPLVYYEGLNFFVFGSVLDAITAHPDFKKEIDEQAFLAYMTMAYVPTPMTIFKNIKKLLPGHCLLIENGKIQIKEYWKIEYKENEINNINFLEELDSLLKNSIMLRERSDVPVGCMLSGGLDSSGVTALFSKQSQNDVHTYSMDFDGKEVSELKYAQLVADQCKTIHHPYRLSLEQAFIELQELIPLMDEPMADSAIVPSYYISKCARDTGIKVVLTGGGGDELYGGYYRHYKHYKDNLIGRFSFLPRTIWQILFPVIPGCAIHYGSQILDKGIAFGLSTSGANLGVLYSTFKDKGRFIQSLGLLKSNFTELTDLEQVAGFSYARMMMDMKHYLPDNILALTDKTSMAASIEARVPLLDHRIVELVFSVNPENNISNKYIDSKKSLKKVFDKILPEEILHRKKAGFNGPVDLWVKNPIVKTRLQNTSNPVINKFFNRSVINKFFDDSKMLSKASETIFMLYVFDLWYKTHVE